MKRRGSCTSVLFTQPALPAWTRSGWQFAPLAMIRTRYQRCPSVEICSSTVA
jgi:hypothetical protein